MSSRITADEAAAKYGYFCTKKTRPASSQMVLGEELIWLHKWVRFPNVQPHGAHCASAYVGYANPECAELFRKLGWPRIKAGEFFEASTAAERTRTLAKLSDRDERRRAGWERDLQAQKVLGEGVFAMVRRSRELRGLI
jgi:hypothetical protein